MVAPLKFSITQNNLILSSLVSWPLMGVHILLVGNVIRILGLDQSGWMTIYHT